MEAVSSETEQFRNVDSMQDVVVASLVTLYGRRGVT